MSWSRTIAGISTTTDAERHDVRALGRDDRLRATGQHQDDARRSLTSCSGSNVAFKSRTRLTLAANRLGQRPRGGLNHRPRD